MGLFTKKPNIKDIDINKIGISLLNVTDPIETRALRFQQDFDEVRIEKSEILNIKSFYIYSILRFKQGIYLQLTDEITNNYNLNTFSHFTKLSLNGYIDKEIADVFMNKIDSVFHKKANNIWIMRDGSFLMFKYKTHKSLLFEYKAD
jgi:hypothetical protein